jgi:prepilin peptidase CpaA
MVINMLVLSTALATFGGIVYSDVRNRLIPNAFIVVILALAAVRIALDADSRTALYTLAASSALFAATFLLFWRGLLGGGDVKLIAATGLLVGYHDLFEFLFVMSVCGAFVAVAVLAVDRLGSRPASYPLTPGPEHHETPARLSVPYGVAIAAAGVTSLVSQAFLLG